jgi:threonine/homoserine/homoserine lactone efflux protein
MILPVDPQKFAVYCGVTVVMAAFPGPANLFSVANGMQKGRRAVLEGVVGMNSATLVWFAAAALGLGALITAFPWLFKAMTLLGAAYVAWLGAKSLRSALKNQGEDPPLTVRPGRSALRDGFAVQISNPKAILFFTAVLPPFIVLNRPLLPQLAMFAVVVIGMDVITMTTYGLGGAALAARMTEPHFRRMFSAVVGALLIGAAVLIATR